VTNGRAILRAERSKMTVLREDERLDAMAAEWLRAHRRGVDTSEAYDELRDLLARARQLGVDDISTAIEEDAGLNPILAISVVARARVKV
jgi:hypothetical protein